MNLGIALFVAAAHAAEALDAPCPSTSAACTVAARCVVIDPGHPSEVSAGRQPLNGTTEVEVTWAISQRLVKSLCNAGLEVIVTRGKRDSLMTNRARAEVANRSGATLFLRLHTDVAPVRGFAVYYPDREGIHEGVRGPSAAMREASRIAANTFFLAMAREMVSTGVPSRGVLGESKTAVGARQGALTGSIHSTIPSVTVEMVTLSDPQDAAVVRSERGATAITDALAAGTLAVIERKSVKGNASPRR